LTSVAASAEGRRRARGVELQLGRGHGRAGAFDQRAEGDAGTAQFVGDVGVLGQRSGKGRK
jgi:hypothetical protein